MGTVVEQSSTSYTVSTVPGGEPLGMENGAIPDASITASSSAGPAPPHLARLNDQACWCAGSADDCYLQIDLGNIHLLCGVATQGNPGGNRDFVKRYKLQHSTDGTNWTVYDENGNDIIEGNTDNWTAKKKDLEQEVITRFVRICPLDWYCWPCLRVELYGAALTIGEKFQTQTGDDSGGYVVEKVLVTTYETHVQENGVPVNEADDISLKVQEKKLIREAKERQRIEEDQENRLEEIQLIIDHEEDKRKKSSDGEMDEERQKAEARLKLVLGEEMRLDENEKPKEDLSEREDERKTRVTEEYSRIDTEHRRRMEELTSMLEHDEDRRRREREEKRKAEEDARKKREEERHKREEELRQKREDERLKWEEEHRKWEEERKRRDRELEQMLEEGRRKRAEERRKREEDSKRVRDEERAKREEERKKRLEEEMRRLEEVRKEREEKWSKKAEVVMPVVDVGLKDEPPKDEENNRSRVEEKKKKEEGWVKKVETPKRIEEEMKKFRDEERKRIEEERKQMLEKEHEEAEKERELKSEIRVLKQERPETITRITIQAVHMTPVEQLDAGQEKRRIEWRMEKIEQERILREQEEKRRQEEAERKREEEKERIKEEEERKRRQQEEERERRKEELRLKREAEERQRSEEFERRRQEEEAKRLWIVEEKKKRLEEDRKKRETEEYLWRREAEGKKKREEEEKLVQDEIKRKKRLSIERKKFEDNDKKRLDELGRKRSEEEERERIEEERKRREEREQWKQKQVERRRSGEIYRRKSEEDLRQRGERLAEKDHKRKQRDSKSFETKWVFISGEYLDDPDSSFVSVSDQSTLESEPPDVFNEETVNTRYVTMRNVELTQSQPDRPEMYFKPIPAANERETTRVTTTTRYITTISTRPSSHDHEHKEPCPSEGDTSIISLENGDVTPYRSQPHCDHLLPEDPAVKEAVESSFFSKFDDNEPKLRPFPSWYGGLDMGSLPHLYFPTNPIRDSEIDRLLDIENEGLQSWRRVKKSGELEIYTRKGLERGSPPINKAIMVLKDVPYRDAIDLIADWDERANWDKTFDGVSFLDQMADFKVIKCSQKKKNRCVVLASLDREEEEPYYAWAWKGSSHPGVPGDDPKVTVMRLETEICGAIVRPYHDATKSCKVTIITQVRGAVPSPLKNTYLSGNPSKWLMWLKKHHSSKVKGTKEKDNDDEKKNDDASSTSSKADKQE